MLSSGEGLEYKNWVRLTGLGSINTAMGLLSFMLGTGLPLQLLSKVTHALASNHYLQSLSKPNTLIGSPG